MTYKDKFFGGIIGSALGDAIGEIAFTRKYNRSSSVLESALQNIEKYIYTDDTAMALGIIESLLANNGNIITRHLGDTFSKNFDLEPRRGYASGPPSIFNIVKKTGQDYIEVAKTIFNGGSFGNGSAMRIAPIGVFFYDSPNIYVQAELSSIVTHTHPIGIDGCAVLAHAIAKAMGLNPAMPFPRDEFLNNLISYARSAEIQEKLNLVKQSFACGWTPHETAQSLVLSVAVHESVPFAIYSFLRHPASYKECLYCSILNGGDRDTMGAMAGAISGAYLGLSDIPQEWYQRLENKSIFDDLTKKLWDLKNTITHHA